MPEGCLNVLSRLELDPPRIQNVNKMTREILYPMGYFAKPPATVTIYFSISSIE